MKTGTCPYSGWGWNGERECGFDGVLCDMCKRDADRENTELLIDGLSLAGLLASGDALIRQADNHYSRTGESTQLMDLVADWSRAYSSALHAHRRRNRD